VWLQLTVQPVTNLIGDVGRQKFFGILYLFLKYKSHLKQFVVAPYIMKDIWRCCEYIDLAVYRVYFCLQ